MTDETIVLLLVLGLFSHVGVAVAAWRHAIDARWIAALNLPIALGTLVHWIHEWSVTIDLGREWHAEDLLVPLYAAAAAVLAAGALARWWSVTGVDWVVLMIHALFMLVVLLAGAALHFGRGGHW